MRYRALVGLVLLVLLAGCGAPMDATVPRGSPQQDVLGWENGYWHNASLDIDNGDGLNGSERDALVARAKARVEYVRGLEFEGSVDISVISRSNFSAGGGDTDEALRRFDNGKFEALFLVGTEEDSIKTQEDSLNRSVAGYYSPNRDAIVIVSDSATPTFDSERTLAHELVHALQDQHFDLGNRSDVRSRDAYNGRNGLVEGDPQAVQFTYLDRCGEAWSCIQSPADDAAENGEATDAAGPHLGIYLMEFFPYSDGPGFVSHLRVEGDWTTVNDAYASPPGSATEVIHPDRYGSFEPREIDLEDDLRDGWSRVEPPDRPAHARIGQSGLVAMFGYTIYDDYNQSAVVSPQELLNLGPTGVDRIDPIDYDLDATRGWTGDRLHVYHRGDETAYRWRLKWNSTAAAERFTATYRSLLQHWGGTGTGEDRFELSEESPFAGAYVIDVDGDTVTVAAAPSVEGLVDVAPEAR